MPKKHAKDKETTTTDFKLDQISDEIIAAFNAAINFAIDDLPSDGAIHFLVLWREGSWNQIEIEYPTFSLESAVICGYKPKKFNKKP